MAEMDKHAAQEVSEVGSEMGKHGAQEVSEVGSEMGKHAAQEVSEVGTGAVSLPWLFYNQPIGY
jgi:hypothetical protein